VKLKNLFHALVLSGTALGVAHCGGGTATEPGANAGTGAPGSGTTLPDGGMLPPNPMPGGGAPGW
jgi:hypothetical protein